MTRCINFRGSCYSPSCQCSVQKAGWKAARTGLPWVGRWVATAAVSSGPVPPPEQPPAPAASVAPPIPVGMAAATQLLEAIPRARTVRELREVQQQAQAQGYFTTAHSVAIIMQLGTLATTSLPAGEADAARQLATKLLGRLRGPQQQTLPPALRVHTERAASLLGLNLDLNLELLHSEGLSGRSHLQHHQHQAGSSTPTTHATSHPQSHLSPQSRGGLGTPRSAPSGIPGKGNPRGGRGRGQGARQGGGQGGGAAPEAGMGGGQVSGALKQPTQQQRAAERGQRLGKPPGKPVAESQSSSPLPLQQGQQQQVPQRQQHQQPQQPRQQQRQTQEQQRQRTGYVHLGAASASHAPNLSDPVATPSQQSQAPPPVSSSGSTPTNTGSTANGHATATAATVTATVTAASASVATTAHPNIADATPHLLSTGPAPVLQLGSIESRNVSLSTSEASVVAAAPEAAVAASVDGEAASMTFQEALQVAWGAWRESSSEGGSAEVAKDPAWKDGVETTLQGGSPDEMAIGDLAEAVHLLVVLRLMPRHEWLCAVQDRLRREMAAATETEVGRVGGVGSGSGDLGQGRGTALVEAYGDGAAAVMADLRQVYEATEELMQMCSEADGQRQVLIGQVGPAGDGSSDGTDATAAVTTSITGSTGRGHRESSNSTSSSSSNIFTGHPGTCGPGSGEKMQAVQTSTTTSRSSASSSTSGSSTILLSSVPSLFSERAHTSAAAHSVESKTASVALQPPQSSPSPLLEPWQSQPRPNSWGQHQQQKHGHHEQQRKEELQQAVTQLEDRGLTRGKEPNTASGGLGQGQSEGQKAVDELASRGEGEEPDDGHDTGEIPAASLERLRVLLRQAGCVRTLMPAGPLTAPGSVGDLHRDGYSTVTAAAARSVVADLTLLLAEAHRAEAAASRTAMVTAAAAAADLSLVAERHLALTAEQVAALVAAARAVHPGGLPSQLLVTAARLLVASSRSGVTCVHVAPVLAACVEAGYTPPSYLLEQLVALAFPTQSPLPPDNKKQLPPEATSGGAAAATPAAAATAAAAVATGHQQQPILGAEPSTAFILALHECSVAQGSLGYRLNNRQFGDWVNAVVRCPLALSPSQLVQLMAACTERGYAVRPTEVASGLVAAAIQPPARLRRLSSSEAVAVVQFAAQQGLQMGADGNSGSGAATSLLNHLAPGRLQELSAAELGRLLPALYTTGALYGHGAGGSAADATAATTAWLADHSAALLPHAEALQPEEVLRLLRCFDQLGYSPPSLLLLGLSLALESQLASAPLLTQLQALHLLLCGRLGFQPNEGLAAAIHEQLLPRLMLAATAATAPQLMLQQQLLEGGGLTMPQRLMVLQVLAAARVRPHPAQLAAVLEVEMAGGPGLQAGLAGDELVALLWHCVVFRALPSWRFIGEWLEAFPATAGSGASAAERADGNASAGGGCQISPSALARVGWCLAHMGLQPEGGWQAAYHAALLPVLPRLDGEALSLVAHSVLLLRSRPSEEWLMALMRAALSHFEQVDAASATRLLHFIAAADVETSKDWIQSFFFHTLRLLEGPAAPEPQASGQARAVTATAGDAVAARPTASPDQIALMLRALARLGVRPPEAWLTAALQRLCALAPALSPACFPVVLMSLVRLCPDLVSEAEPGGVVDVLVRAAYKKRGEFTALELHWLLEALGCYPAYELPAAAAENLLAALRRLEEGLEEETVREAAGSGDLAIALGDDVSASWLAWGNAIGAEAV